MHSSKEKFMSVNVNTATGVVEFPVYYMRGGTSTGLVIWEGIAPQTKAQREELLRLIMGAPLSGSILNNNQLNGLGRATPTTNKVFFVSVAEQSEQRVKLVSTLAQLSADHADIDWSVNCGNMSSAIPLWAYDHGLLPQVDNPELEILNTNTGVATLARLYYTKASGFELTEIPGINGCYPSVDLFLQNPVGAKTGRLLPTGKAKETIDGIEVSCVDVAVPMVIVKAEDVGMVGDETPSQLNDNLELKQRLMAIWVEAGLRMGLKTKQGSFMTVEELQRSETIPKICLITKPKHNDANIAVRYFTPQKAHASMAVTGGCCLASACLVDGSVAAQVAERIQRQKVADGHDVTKIRIENPAGVLETEVTYQSDPHRKLSITGAAYKRTAQILVKGWVPLIGASAKLRAALTLDRD
ncbi:PrpF domain-containing protein [Vibrio tritonius]|uniref:PrpF domain-containing protein n=1 Tax=Vibrio tritonius TaxID=1435069 RepID=UPI00315CB07A